MHVSKQVSNEPNYRRFTKEVRKKRGIVKASSSLSAGAHKARSHRRGDFVKKAANWALRNIGKRNLNLNKAAIKVARVIQRIDSKVAGWVSSTPSWNARVKLSR